MNKILFLTNMFPSVDSPSYGIFVEKTYCWLKKRYSVDLVKVCKCTDLHKKIFNYIKFYLTAIIKGVLFPYECVYAHYISHCALPVRIIRFFHRNIVIVGNIHGEDVFSDYKRYQKNRKYAAIFMKYCDYIIAPSEYYKARLNAEYGFRKERIFVSPSGGVNTTLFVPKEINVCKEKMKLNTSKRHIGMVSRIEEGKGWDVFIKVAKMIPYKDVEFVIVGSGSQDEKAKNLIEEEGVQNKFILIPKAGHDILPDIYGSFDVFCFPTRINTESLGLVGIEAMSCELPCIISAIPGPSSYCNEENCVRFESNDVYQLKDAIIKVLEMNECELLKMKRNARMTAQEYDSKKVEKNFMCFFSDIMKI